MRLAKVVLTFYRYSPHLELGSVMFACRISTIRLFCPAHPHKVTGQERINHLLSSVFPLRHSGQDHV